MPRASRLRPKERVALALARKEADRIPRADSFWPETLERWRREGLGAGADVAEMFEFDLHGPNAWLPGWPNHLVHIGRDDLVEETAETELRRDGNGALLRYWKGRSGAPEHVGFAVDSPDAWRAARRDLLAAPIAARAGLEGFLARMRASRARDLWFPWMGWEGFELAKDLVGHETLCAAMAEEPGWARDMFDTQADLTLRILDHLEAGGARVDGGWIFGDIAYNHGPFFSPRMYRELLQPSHRRLAGWFKARGLPVIYHTDGDFRPLIPDLLECGFDCFQPLEAKAGVDVRALKREYGDRVAFMGNIDAAVLSTNDAALIEAEVASKLEVAKKGGGYLYHSDHSVPPGVTWETYRLVMRLVEEHGRFGGA
jgi:uroporphyrinogen decarboxylase